MVSLVESGATSEEVAEVIALDVALKDLAEMDPRKSQIVEMKFFGGLTTEEVAEVLKVTPRTVEREWRKALAVITWASNSREHGYSQTASLIRFG